MPVAENHDFFCVRYGKQIKLYYIMSETNAKGVEDTMMKILSYKNQIRLNTDGTEAQIRPVLEIGLERAATVFVAQYIDGMEMFPSTRYELQQGAQSVFLKTMRVIRPGSDPYRFSIKVFLATPDGKAEELEDVRQLRADMEIRLLLPLPGAEESLLRSDWKEQLAIRGAGYVAGGDGNLERDQISFPEPVCFSWQGGTAPYTLTLTGGGKVKTVSCSGPCCEVWNLFTGTEYRWHVTDSTGAVSAEQHFFTAYGPRLIAVPARENGPVNLRDIGGYRSISGGVVRQGMAYRGSDHAMFLPGCPENHAFLRDELQIRTELDLRYAENVVGRTGSDLGDSVRWVHRPVNAYHSFTPEQCELFRETIRLFADPGLYPVFFHCNGGCDRTGEIAFLLNALLGVPEEELMLDYELSSLSFFPRKRSIEYFVEWRTNIAAYAPGAGNWMERVEKYLLAIGVTAEEIASIRRNLIAV